MWERGIPHNVLIPFRNSQRGRLQDVVGQGSPRCFPFALKGYGGEGRKELPEITVLLLFYFKPRNVRCEEGKKKKKL